MRSPIFSADESEGKLLPSLLIFWIFNLGINIPFATDFKALRLQNKIIYSVACAIYG